MNIEQLKWKLKEKKTQDLLMKIWIWVFCIFILIVVVRSVISLIVTVLVLASCWALIYLLFSKNWIEKTTDYLEDTFDKIKKK